MAERGRAAATARPWKGRLVFWRGGIIWIGDVADETGFHEHHAIQITLTLSGTPVRFRTPCDDWKPYSASMVAPNQSHAFAAGGNLVALVFIEPESLTGRALRERSDDGIASLDAAAMAGLAAQLRQAYEQGAPDRELTGLARAVAAQLSATKDTPAKPLDVRIERALSAVQERLDGAVALADIAGTVHLSPERFRHLFLQETGIRFRPYVLWLRMETALAAYAAGSSLTQASHAGGFADSAHFSRTFRRMFGVPAMDVQRA
jgi:AraC family transcriptional regulator